MSFCARLNVRTAALLVSAAAALLGACALKGPPAGTPDPHPRSVQIQRTAYGVAHIQAAEPEALAYGVAYAQAEDNFCQTAEQLVTVRGERSRFFGPDTAGRFGLRALRNEQIDIYIRGLMDDGELALAESLTSAEAQALARGYVAGYNRFLGDRLAHRGPPLPAACAGQPWLGPMTLADYRRMNELAVTQAGAVALADAVVAARLPSAGAPAPKPVGLQEAAAALVAYRLNDLPMGSNAWAFGAETSLDGRGLLMGNPHFPWSGGNRFWQMHLTMPGQLDVMGAALGASPLVAIGFNKDLAWSHTVSTGKRFTLHELKLVPGDPARYLVGGVAERMRARTVRYEALRPDGTLESRLHTVWMTRFGPVVALPRVGLEWTAQTAYALQDTNTWNLRATDTWLAIGRAASIDQLQAALRLQGVPWVNTLAADRHGDVLYADASAVPDVDAEQLKRCAPASRTAAGLYAAAGLVVLDGSRSECQWRRDPASAVPGLVPPSRMPTLERRDWVQNANDSYWLSNPALALDGITPLVGPVGVPQGLRTRAGIAQIMDRLAGQDGLAPHGKVGLAEMQAMLLMNRNQAAAMVLDDLLAACAAPVVTGDAGGAAAGSPPPPPLAVPAVASAPARKEPVAAARAALAATAVRGSPAATRSAAAKAAPAKVAGAKPGVRQAAKAPATRVANAVAKPAAPPMKSAAGSADKPSKPGLQIESLPPTAAGITPARPAAAAASPLPLGAVHREACGVLAAWDRRDDLASRGALLFRTWWHTAREIPGLWRVPFGTGDPVHTPSGLKMSDAKVRGRVFDALAQAVASLRAAGLALDVPLGEVQHRTTPAGPIPLHGGDEAEGVLNKVEALDGAPLGPGGIEIDHGSSYLQSVGFDDRGPVAQGLLTYGQSSDAASPHAFDQLPLFSQKQWPVLPFWPEDVAKARVGDVLTLVLERRPEPTMAPNPIPIPPPMPVFSPASAPAPAPAGATRSKSN